MKLKFTLILLSFSIISNGQISILKNANVILTSPDIANEISIELVQFHLEEYKELNLEIEMKLSTTKSNEEKESLEKDLETLEEYLQLWIEEKNENQTLEFLEIYDDSRCYELETINETISMSGFKVEQTAGETMYFIEEFEVEKKAASGRWVKKRKNENCLSQNPDDCYVACYEKSAEMFIIKETGESIPTHQLPEGYYFDKDNSLLRKEIQLTENEYLVINNDSGEPTPIIDWVEVECN